MPADIGGSASRQRSYSLPPETGTTTTAAIPAWAVLTAYVVDATGSGINTVTNAGNLYQCITAGTSASIGGPTTTSTNITDGTAHWRYLGANPSQNVTSGSQIIGIVARGTQSTIPGGAGNIPPTDNDSGTYSTISNTNYSGFADSFAGVFRRSTAANTKTGFTTSAQFGGTSVGSGAGDEITNMWLELRNVAVGAPHTFSQVERASATSGVVTAASITTTKPCLIVSIWFGNGNVLSAGTAHTATPLNGLVVVPGCSRIISLSTSGYIQINVATRLAGPGTSAEQWNTGSEGAQLVTLAFEDTSTITVDDDLGMYLPRPAQPVWAPIALFAALGAIARGDELGPAASTVVDGDEPVAMRAQVEAWRQASRPVSDDDLAVGLDDDGGAGARPWPGWCAAVGSAAVDDLAVITIDDETAPAARPSMFAWWSRGVVLDEDVPSVLDDDQVQLVAPWQSWCAVSGGMARGDDDLVVAAVLAVLDDDVTLGARTWAPTWTSVGLFADVEVAPTAIDDDQPRALVVASAPWLVSVAPADADFVPFVTLPIVDDDSYTAMRGMPWPSPPPAPMADAELVPAPAAPVYPTYGGAVPSDEIYDGPTPSPETYGGPG